MKKRYQSGSASAVAIICLVLALVVALGWIFYTNFVAKEEPKKDTDLIVVDKKDDDTKSDQVKYIDLRKDKKDSTGTVVASAADVDKLEGVGEKLKTYLKTEAGKSVEAMDGAVKQTFTIDRIYGDYAAGAATGHYAIWGPKDGTGDVTEVAGTQNLGMPCKDLTAAKVPAQLVDSKCLADDGSGLTDYKN
ncbi:MAG TPA: hypothetical protein VGE34_02005 [Candidatus Saccharimonadales bacterium]